MMREIKMMKLFLAGVIIFSIAGYVSCAGAQTQIPKQVVIYFTSGTTNELFLCGCVERLGGLGRRKTALDECEYPKVVVDVGGFAKSSSRIELMKTETLLKAYNEMDYAVINLGNTEYRLGLDLIKDFEKISKAPFISANIADEKGDLVFAPYKIISVEGLKIGFIGVTTSAFIKDEVQDGFRVLDIEHQVAKYVPEVKRQSDLLVVLANARDNEIEKISSGIQGVDIVLGGLTYNHPAQDKPTRVTGTLVHKNGGLGRYIGRLRLDLQTSKPVKITNYEGYNKPLPEKMAEDAKILKILDEYRTALKTTDFTRPKSEDDKKSDAGEELWDDSIRIASEESGFSETSTYLSYASAKRCAECHEEIYKEWSKTRHAGAFQTLIEDQEDKNPQCLRCHTVGYRRIGGYVSYEQTPDLAGVQCESCHGGGARHVLAMESKEISGPAITRTVPQAFCTRCHDEENDPDFSMTQKLPLINHGKNE